MIDQLEKEIRQLFCDSGPLERVDVISLLLGLLYRIQNIEDKLNGQGELTEDEIDEFARALEAKLKEKNT